MFMLSGRVKSQTIADVNWQGEQVMRLVTQTVRNARTIDLPAIGSTGTTLSLTTLNPLQSPTVFSIASGTLFVTEGSGPAIPLTNSHVTVSSLLFQNVSSTSSSDRIVSLSFVITYTNLSGRNEHEFSKTFKGSATLRQ